MAFKTPQNSPLTETQLELTAKIGSMKNLLSLPFTKFKNIPKNEQISTFDYLIKILRALGFSEELLFRQFLEKIFSLTGTFLEDKILEAIGAALDAKGIKLSDTDSNADYLKRFVPNNFLQGVKTKMINELMVMVFGARNGASEKLVSDPVRRNELIDQAICGFNMFSLSNNPKIKNQDVQFNRAKIKQELEKGEVTFEINCQTVKIKLPEDPVFVFTGGGTGTISSNVVEPAQQVYYAVNYVKNETGKINNTNNSEAAGKSFFQILIEKLLSYITTLVIPHVGPIFAFLALRPQTSNITVNDIMYNNCSIEQNPNDQNKTAFCTSLINALYKELLKIILVFVIREFKKLVANYFAKSARERLTRKANKIKLKFSLLNGSIDNASKAAAYAAALSSLNSILEN